MTGRAREAFREWHATPEKRVHTAQRPRDCPLSALPTRRLQLAAVNFKRTALELGGKAPQIIFDDANLDAAIQGSAMGLFFNQGEVCAAGTRILAHVKVHETVLEGLKAAAEARIVGDPFDPSTTMGPLVNKRQRDRARISFSRPSCARL
jgi:acyl-CoA reductase-like NAD-dependent aldehyde dehydrogenase